MSGEFDMLISSANAVYNRVAEMKRLKELRKSINEVEKHLVNMENNIKNQTMELNKVLNEFENRDKKELEKKRDNRGEVLKKLLEEYYSITNSENNTEIEREIEKINQTEDNVEMIKKFAKVKSELIIEIDEKIAENEKIREEQEMFGIVEEKDFEDEKKMSLYSMYNEMKEMGYNPIFDPKEEKILVIKDNGDQIETINKDGKVKMKFHDYNGKDCSKDMAKIEQGFKRKNLIKKDERIYTHWYDKKEKESNKKLVLENNNVYEEYKKNYKKNKL